MGNISIFQGTAEELAEIIGKGVKSQLDELKKEWQPKEPTEFLSRNEVAALLKVDLSTIHNYCKRKILQPYQISGGASRVYFKRIEVENAMVKLEK